MKVYFLDCLIKNFSVVSVSTKRYVDSPVYGVGVVCVSRGVGTVNTCLENLLPWQRARTYVYYDCLLHATLKCISLLKQERKFVF